MKDVLIGLIGALIGGGASLLGVRWQLKGAARQQNERDLRIDAAALIAEIDSHGHEWKRGYDAFRLATAVAVNPEVTAPAEAAAIAIRSAESCDTETVKAAAEALRAELFS